MFASEKKNNNILENYVSTKQYGSVQCAKATLGWYTHYRDVFPLATVALPSRLA